MKKLSFVVRLFLSNIAFVIPICVLIWQMYNAKTVNIDFSRQEELGNLYQKPLEDVLEHVSMHRLLLHRQKAGDSGLNERIQQAQTKADEAFAKLGKVDSEIGEALQFTDEGLSKRKRGEYSFTKMKERWEKVKTQAAQMSNETISASHLELIAGLRTMITHSGDTSNLILDPDLDSYYLMDVTLLALPQMQDHLQDIIVNTEALLRKSELNSEEKTQLAVYVATLKEVDLARVVASADTSFNEDANFYGVSPSLNSKISPLLASHKKDAEALIGYLHDLSVGKSISLATFQAAGDAALQSNFALWRASVEELDVLLHNRISVLLDDRSTSVVYALIALITATLLSVYIGHTLRANVKGLFAVIGNLRDAAEATATTSRQLVDNSQKLSSAATEQAAAIQETVATLNEIDAMAGRSTDSVTRSTESARVSQEVALTGRAAVDDMIKSMDQINESNKDILEAVVKGNTRISEITRVISEIGDKTKIINDIVFQTKLLSFNASVEAARAGEHGKGFAVVAEEIGSLAQMSGNAASEISSMLSSSIQHVNSIVEDTKTTVERLIREGQDRISEGTMVANRCGEVLDDVVNNVQTMNQMMDQIGSAQKEQIQGVSQISTAMNQLDSTTLQNSESAERTSDYAESLSKQSENLRQLVDAVEGALLGTQNAA